MTAEESNADSGGLGDKFVQDCGEMSKRSDLSDKDVRDLLELWSTFKCRYESNDFENADRCLESLLICTSRIVFNLQYSKKISANCKQQLKDIIIDCGTALGDSPRKRLCNGISTIIESPWTAASFNDVVKPKSKNNHEASRALWDTEGWIMLETRIDYLARLGTKCIDRICPVLEVLVENGHQIFKTNGEAPSLVHKECFHPYQFPYGKYVEYLEVFALLYVHKHIKTKITDTWKEQVLLDVISSLAEKETNLESTRLFPKLKLWKDVGGVAKVLAKEATWKALKSEGALLLEEFFKKWMTVSGCGADGMEQAELESPIDEILMENELISCTEHMYKVAKAIVQSMGKTSFTRPKYVELFVIALTKDITAIEELKNAKIDKSDVIKDLDRKLSLRYLDLAKFFDDYPKTAKDCLLTAFSLNPCYKLYQLLFPSANSEAENVAVIPENEEDTIPSEYDELKDIDFDQSDSTGEVDLGLGTNLFDDLAIAIHNPRYKGFIGTSGEELKKNCRNLLDSKSVTVIENKKLDHLDVDYEKYKDLKPQYDPDDDGIEKGYRLGERLRTRRNYNVLKTTNRSLLGGSSMKIRKMALNRSRKHLAPGKDSGSVVIYRGSKGASVRKGRPPKTKTWSGDNCDSVSSAHRKGEDLRQMPNICLNVNPWCASDIRGGFFGEFFHTCIRAPELSHKEKSSGRDLKHEAHLFSCVEKTERRRQDHRETVGEVSSHASHNGKASTETGAHGVEDANADLSLQNPVPASSFIKLVPEATYSKFKMLGIPFPKEVFTCPENYPLPTGGHSSAFFEDPCDGVLKSVIYTYHLEKIIETRSAPSNLPYMDRQPPKSNRQLKGNRNQHVDKRSGYGQKQEAKLQKPRRQSKKPRDYSGDITIQTGEPIGANLGDLREDIIGLVNEGASSKPNSIEGTACTSNDTLEEGEEIIGAPVSAPLPVPTPPPKPAPEFAGAFQIMGTYTKENKPDNCEDLVIPTSPFPIQRQRSVTSNKTPTKEQIHKWESTVNIVSGGQPGPSNTTLGTQPSATPVQDAIPATTSIQPKPLEIDVIKKPLKTYSKVPNKRRLVIKTNWHPDEFKSVIPKSELADDVPSTLNHNHSPSTTLEQLSYQSNVSHLTPVQPQATAVFNSDTSHTSDIISCTPSHNQVSLASHPSDNNDDTMVNVVTPQVPVSTNFPHADIPPVATNIESRVHCQVSSEKGFCRDGSINGVTPTTVCSDNAQNKNEKRNSMNVHGKSNENFLNVPSSSFANQEGSSHCENETEKENFEVRNKTFTLPEQEATLSEGDEKFSRKTDAANPPSVDESLREGDQSCNAFQNAADIGEKDNDEKSQNLLEKNNQVEGLDGTPKTKPLYDDSKSQHEIDNFTTSNSDGQTRVHSIGSANPVEQDLQVDPCGLSGENSSNVNATKSKETVGSTKHLSLGLGSLTHLQSLITKKSSQNGDPKCTKNVDSEIALSTPICNGMEGTEYHSSMASRSVDTSDKIEISGEKSAASALEVSISSASNRQPSGDRNEVEGQTGTTENFSFAVNTEVHQQKIFNEEKNGLMMISETQNSTFASFVKPSEESNSQPETEDVKEDADKTYTMNINSEADGEITTINDGVLSLNGQGHNTDSSKNYGDTPQLQEHENCQSPPNLSCSSGNSDVEPSITSPGRNDQCTSPCNFETGRLEDGSESEQSNSDHARSSEVTDDVLGMLVSESVDSTKECDNEKSRHSDEGPDKLLEPNVVSQPENQNQSLGAEHSRIVAVVAEDDSGSFIPSDESESIPSCSLEETANDEGGATAHPQDPQLPAISCGTVTEPKTIESDQHTSSVDEENGEIISIEDDEPDLICLEDDDDNTTEQEQSNTIVRKIGCTDANANSKIGFKVASSLLPHGTSGDGDKVLRPLTPVNILEDLINKDLKKKSNRHYDEDEDPIRVAQSVVKHVEQNDRQLRRLVLCTVKVERLRDDELPEKARNLLKCTVKRSTRLKKKKMRTVEVIKTVLQKSSNSADIAEDDAEETEEDVDDAAQDAEEDVDNVAENCEYPEEDAENATRNVEYAEGDVKYDQDNDAISDYASNDSDSDIVIIEEISHTSSPQHDSMQPDSGDIKRRKLNVNKAIASHGGSVGVSTRSRMKRPLCKRKRSSSSESSFLEADSPLNTRVKRIKNGKCTEIIPGRINGYLNSNDEHASGSSTTEVEDEDPSQDDLDSSGTNPYNNSLFHSTDLQRKSENEEDPLAYNDNEVAAFNGNNQNLEMDAIIIDSDSNSRECNDDEGDNDGVVNGANSQADFTPWFAQLGNQKSNSMPSTVQKSISLEQRKLSAEGLDTGNQETVKENLVEESSSDIEIIDVVPNSTKSINGLHQDHVTKNHSLRSSCKLKSSPCRQHPKSRGPPSRLKPDKSPNNPSPSLSSDQNNTIPERTPDLPAVDSMLVADNFSTPSINEESASNMANETGLVEGVQDNDTLPNSNDSIYILPDANVEQYIENDDSISNESAEMIISLEQFGSSLPSAKGELDAEVYVNSCNHIGDQAAALQSDSSENNTPVECLSKEILVANQETAVEILDVGSPVCNSDKQRTGETILTCPSEPHSSEVLPPENSMDQYSITNSNESIVSEDQAEGIIENEHRSIMGRSETVAEESCNLTVTSSDASLCEYSDAENNDSFKSQNTETHCGTLNFVADTTPGAAISAISYDTVENPVSDNAMVIDEYLNSVGNGILQQKQRWYLENDDDACSSNKERGRAEAVADDDVVRKDEDQHIEVRDNFEVAVLQGNSDSSLMIDENIANDELGTTSAGLGHGDNSLQTQTESGSVTVVELEMDDEYVEENANSISYVCTDAFEMCVENEQQQAINIESENEEVMILSSSSSVVTIDDDDTQHEHGVASVTPINESNIFKEILTPETCGLPAPVDVLNITYPVGEDTQNIRNKENAQQTSGNEGECEYEEYCSEMTDTDTTAECNSEEMTMNEGMIEAEEDMRPELSDDAMSENDHYDYESMDEACITPSPPDTMLQPGSPEIPKLTPEILTYESVWNSDDEPPVLEKQGEIGKL